MREKHSMWLNGAVISDVRKLWTHNQSTQAVRVVEGMWDMKSFQLPHLEPKYSSEEYILGKNKKQTLLKEFCNLSIKLIGT